MTFYSTLRDSSSKKWLYDIYTRRHKQSADYLVKVIFRYLKRDRERVRNRVQWMAIKQAAAAASTYRRNVGQKFKLIENTIVSAKCSIIMKVYISVLILSLALAPAQQHSALFLYFLIHTKPDCKSLFSLNSALKYITVSISRAVWTLMNTKKAAQQFFFSAYRQQ